MKPPTPLRNKVRFERRSTVRDGLGGYEGDWASLGARLCRLTPTRGNEEVVATRLSGLSGWDLWCRYDSVTKGLTGHHTELLHGDDQGESQSFAPR